MEGRTPHPPPAPSPQERGELRIERERVMEILVKRELWKYW
jgi:hypothetical protein